MKEKVSLESIFRTEASAFGRQQIVERSFHEVVEGRGSEELARLIADRRAKLSWLIGKAQENLSSMLNAGGEGFELYIESLFKQETHSFKDSLGICGFNVPKLKWEKATGETSRQIPSLGDGAQTKVLVGTQDDYAVNARILEIYAEKIAVETPERHFHMEDLVEDHSGPQVCQILALSTKAPNGYTDLAFEQIRNAKLVHLEQTTRSNTFKFDYSKADPVSLDQGFIDTLLELVMPETTLRLLFKKFGLPKRK